MSDAPFDYKKGSPIMTEAAHVADLRAAFPGIWIREDGAFRWDDGHILWIPGNVEAADDRGGFYSEIRTDDGRVFIPGGSLQRPGTVQALRLSQLRALVAYIEAVSRQREAIDASIRL